MASQQITNGDQLREIFVHHLNRMYFGKCYLDGIYLAHALLLYLLDDFLSVSYKLCDPFISIPLTAILCFGLTLLLVWLISKIPVIGRWISG